MELISYIIIFFLILSPIFYGVKYKELSWVIIGYIMLFIISALRFDIGNDYKNYFYLAQEYANLIRNSNILYTWHYYGERHELSFVLLSWFFSYTEKPFVWINVIYSAIYAVLLYSIFKKYDVLLKGIIIIIISGFLFFSWDGIRQGVAVVSVLYAIHYVRIGKFEKFCIWIFVAFLFHKSSIYLLPLYGCRYFKLNNSLINICISVSYIIFLSGYMNIILDNVTSYFQYIDEFSYYVDSEYSNTLFTSIGYKIRTTLLLIPVVVLINNIPDYESCLKNIITIGVIIFTLANGNMLFTRIAWYFLIALTIGSSFINVKIKSKSNLLIKIGVLILFVLLFRDIITHTNVKGCVPYDWILSSNFENLIFRIKNY